MKRHFTNSEPPIPVKIILFLAFLGLVIFLLANVIAFLWNSILVDLTGVKEISLIQAIGLFLLARILFGGFNFRSKAKRFRAKRKAFKDKWKNMSDDERAEMKAAWKERCKKK